MSSHWKTFAYGVALSSLYFAIARAGLVFASYQANASPVWPASGYAVSALLLFGPRFWPAIFFGAFFANIIEPTHPLISLGIAAGNSLEALTGVWLIGLLSKWKRKSAVQYQALVIVVVAAVASMVSAFVGPLCLSMGKGLSILEFLTVASTWFTGDLLGILMILPLVTAWAAGERPCQWKGRSLPWLEWLALMMLVTLGGVAIFLSRGQLPLLLGAYPLIFLAAMRLGIFDVKFAAVLLSTVSIVCASFGRGPFHLGSMNQNLIYLQLFLSSISLTALGLADLKRSGSLRLPGIAMGVIWLLMGAVFYSFHLSESHRDEQHLEKLIQQNVSLLHDRLDAYEAALRAGVSLIAASTSVERDEWRQFVKAGRIEEKYPGLLGLGVIHRVARAKERAFLRAVLRDSAPDFQIHPALVPQPVEDYEGSVLDRFVITYIEPTAKNFPALGLDIGAERVRRVAAEISAETGLSRMTSEIRLVQDKKQGSGFLLFLPFYRKESHLYSDQDRRDAHLGWVYAPFTAESFFRNALQGGSEEVAPYVFISDAFGHLVYAPSGDTTAPAAFDGLSRVQLAGQDFLIGWKRLPGFVSSHDSTSAWIMALGSLVAILSAYLLSGLQSINRRAEAIAGEKTKLLAESESHVRSLNRQLENRVAERTHQLEEALQGLTEREKKLSRLADSMPQIVWITGQGGQSIFHNQRFWEYTGLNPRTATREEIVATVHPDDQAAAKVVREAMIERGQDISLEYRLRRHDGQYLWHLARFVSVYDADGVFLEGYGTATDISDVKKAEEEKSRLMVSQKAALETARIKSEFLANMSHEVRTPISGVSGLASLLLTTNLDPEQRDYVESVRRCVDSLMTVINDILDFSKVEAGKLDLETIPFGLNSLLSDCERSMGYSAQLKGLALKIHGLEGEPSFIGDPGRIRQVLVNLISNAIKFTPKGIVEVRATSAPESEGVELVHLSVRDTGIGIKPEARDRIFDAFTQADSSVSRKFGGTGLGLSICKKLVELMKGRIGVESEWGKGSTFWFEVLLPRAENVEDLRRDKVLPVIAPGRFRVLLAEDNEINQKVAVKQLEWLGYQVDAVADGQAALAALGAQAYDLVLMDCQMPGMDGYEATRRIRASEGCPWRDIPVIALTANAVSGEREKCIEAGMSDYLSKPVSRESLSNKLSAWLGRKVESQGSESTG